MDKEQKEVTICKECVNGYINKPSYISLSIRCKKCKKTVTNYITGEKSEEYSYEKQEMWNIKGKCPHYRKRTGPIKEIINSKERHPLCDVEFNAVPVDATPWYKKLFRLK